MYKSLFFLAHSAGMESTADSAMTTTRENRNILRAHRVSLSVLKPFKQRRSQRTDAVVATTR